ncbi:MAG: hypothetical protein AAFR68_06630 [Pseudomonadota bacterium]
MQLSRQGHSGNQNRHKKRDEIDLEDIAGTSDFDLDLSDPDSHGTITAKSDTNSDDTIDKTEEVEVSSRGSVKVSGTDGDNTVVHGDSDDSCIGSAGESKDILADFQIGRSAF